MATRRDLWLLLPKPLRTLPADLAAVVAVVVLTGVVVLTPGLNETPLRVVLGLPFVLFFPGYALVAVLFPEAGSDTAATGDAADEAEDSTLREGDGIDGIERVALSLGLSLAVVPLVGLVLNFTPWGIRLTPILFGISALTLGFVALAARRRQELPPEERFRVPYREWLATARAEFFQPDSGVDAALNVLLAASVLLALGAVGFAVMVPPDGESFSEFYLLTETENGDRVAADYPQEFELGDSRPVVVGVGNHENEPTEYTVVVQLQEVSIEDNETTVLERTELDRFQSPTLEDNETWEQEFGIQPTRTGENLRVQFLLYRGDPPASPTAENAYRTTHLWVTVRA